MASLKVVVFMGSVRPGRVCDRVKDFVVRALKSNGFIPIVFDPAEVELPLLETPLHLYYQPERVPAALREINAHLLAADAFVVLSCEYNHSVPPALSNALAYFPPASYAYRPSGIVCYSMGPYGGVRAAIQLRCLLSELATPSVPTLFAIPTAHTALDSDGYPTDADSGSQLSAVCQKMIDELRWYAEAMAAQRANATGK